MTGATRITAARQRTTRPAITWLKQSYLANAAEFIRLGREEEQIAFGHEIPNVMLLHATDFTTLMLPSLLDLLHTKVSGSHRWPKWNRITRSAWIRMRGSRTAARCPTVYLNSRHLKYPPFQPEPVEKLDSMCR